MLAERAHSHRMAITPNPFAVGRKRIFLRFTSLLALVLVGSIFPGLREIFPQDFSSDAPTVSDSPFAGEIIEPVNITATRSRKRLNQIPAAVSRTDFLPQESELRPAVTLDETLPQIPGLFSQNPFNFAQDLRLSIRGFGVRSPFGVRGIKILVDGFAETLPDGQTQVDSIDPGIIDRIEVLRGPSSSLYGNASGGVISIITEEGPALGWQFSPRLTWGAFGFAKQQVKLAGVAENLRYRINASHLKLDGFRENSSTENTLVQGKFNIVSDSYADWTISFGHFDSPRADDPGSLTREQAAANPEQANGRNLLFAAGEKVEQQNIGIKYDTSLSAFHELTFTTQLIRRIFSNKLPFVNGGIVQFDRLAPGAGIKSVYDKKLFGRANRLIVGVDTQYQRDDRQRFNNNLGAKENRVLDQVEEVVSVGPYIRNEMLLSENLELVGGARFDRVHFRVGDRFSVDDDQSGSRTLSQWTGTLGAVFHWSPELHFYANAATVFETPTTTELINNPAGVGGFNPDLDSQESISYEIGSKGALGNVFRYDMALFYMRSNDEIIPFELPQFPQRTFFRNAGESERKGVEVVVNFKPLPRLRGSLSYTFSDFRFADFVSGVTNLGGNAIPGIPAHRIYGKLCYRNPGGIFVEWEAQYVDDFFVDNENSSRNTSYTLSNLRLGIRRGFRSFRGSAFLGVNNLLDETYNSNTRINAANRRFFEPAPPFNLYGGISLVYTPAS